MRQRKILALLSGLALAIPAGALVPGGPAHAAAAVAPVAALAPPAADRMPGDVPTKKTPWVLDGEVTKIIQIGTR